MELLDAIKKALDHEGVLFLGSGFSIGGKNRKNEELKVGSGLSRAICRDLKINESDNLAISSQRYIEDPKCKKSLNDFINFLSDELTCTEVSRSQEIIASLPWKRIYTTNYDNTFECASEKSGYNRTSITITNSRYAPGRKLDQAIIHINGSILNLNEKTFYDEFKITDDNYTRNGLLQSPWKNLFDNDFESAGCIIFVGYSLQYDQELVRHIANLSIIDKCIFIDIDFNDDDKEFKISRYGKLEKIGSDGFAKRIEEVKKTYSPNIKGEHLKGFDKKEVSEYYGKGTYSSSDVLDLLVKGKLNRQFMGHKNYCVLRKKKVEEVKTLLKNKDIIIIQSKLGNGKTVFLDCIAKEISSEYNVFVVNDLNNYIDDITYVQGLINKHNVLLIDDYGYFIPLLKSLGKDFPENLKIIMTCRTSININLYSDLIERYNFDKDTIEVIDIDNLDDGEISDVVNVLNNSRLWGRYDVKTNSQKKKLIKKDYDGQISKIFYLLLNSEVIKRDIDKIIHDVKNKIGLYDFIIALAINNICRLKFKYYEILEYINISDSLLKSYILDKDVRELLDISSEGFSLSSSIFSQYLVREGFMKEQILNMLSNMYVKCSEGDETYGIHYQQRRNMISRSNIILLLGNKGNDKVNKNDENSILRYYDGIKNLPTASENPYFWLEFGITALNLDNYNQASIYFDNAYANAKNMENFDTFQIDTHKARLLLCSEMYNNQTNAKEAVDTFLKAHELLLHNSNSGEKIRYVLRQVGRYNEYYTYYFPILNDAEKNLIINSAYNIREKFKEYFNSLGKFEINSETAMAYLKYRELFKNTGHILGLKEIDECYNARQKNTHLRIKL